jgi:hypothetical protein
MSEKVLLTWMENLDRRLGAVAAGVAGLQQSLAVCQAQHQGERVAFSRRRNAVVKILAGVVVAAVSALATKYFGAAP